MTRTGSIIAVLATLIVAGTATYLYTVRPDAGGPVSNAEDASVRAFVADFGATFKNVSLLADDAPAQIAEAYGPFVSPEILAKWQSKPENAPGRLTSSPWPDRIEVISVTPSGEGYAVEGTIIEVTSTAELAATYPLILRVEKRAGGWEITEFTKGSYSEIPHRQSIVGYWECLPPKGSGPHTLECAFGIAVDQSDGHYAVNTMLMSAYPVDFPTGTKVRVTGIVTPANQLSSEQRYDIDGIISATSIEEL